MVSEKKEKIEILLKIGFISAIFIFWAVVFLDFRTNFNRTPVSVWCKSPSIVPLGTQFDFDIQIWDEYERISPEFNGEITLTLESYNLTNNFTRISDPKWDMAIKKYQFIEQDAGIHRFTCSINSSGAHYIQVQISATKEIYRSNPVIVKPASEIINFLYWGDIHSHSYYSDGSGNPKEVYTYARDNALCDFAALTDHLEIFPHLGLQDIGGNFQNYIKTTNDFNENNKFTTLMAVEWTPMLADMRANLSSQHTNFYFKGDTVPYFSSFDIMNPDSVYDYLNSQNAGEYIAWTHHTTRKGQAADYAYYNESINRMVEIYSCHGSSEFQGDLNLYHEIDEIPISQPGYSINDALRMGRKFGFMASSDSHDGKMGHPLLHTAVRTLNNPPFSPSAYRYGVQYKGGLTGIYTSTLDRSNIFQGLFRRSAYATTWINRHYLEFSINNVSIGQNDSTLILNSVIATRTLKIVAAIDGVSTQPNSENRIERIDIIKNSDLWHSIRVNRTAVELIVEDSSPITGTGYNSSIQKSDGQWYVCDSSIKPVNPNELTTKGSDYYYIRLLDNNYGAAWIGPIWVEYQS